jgi:hypothetical protein
MATPSQRRAVATNEATVYLAAVAKALQVSPGHPTTEADAQRFERAASHLHLALSALTR